MLQTLRFENTPSRSFQMTGRAAAQAQRTLHCIAVNPRGVSEMSGLWFRSAEEADAAFDSMAQSQSMKQHTLERFRLLVAPGLSDARLNELVIAAVQWEAYLPIIAREGVLADADVHYAEPMGAYELAWPHDADPEVGIRPRG